MAENINILEVYNKAFGQVGAPFPAFINIGNPATTIVKTVKGAFNFRSELGNDFMFPLTFYPDTPQEWQLPIEPIISISGSNNIKETPLTRGDRIVNVLEYINLNNYKLRIRGVFYSDEEDTYPESDVRRLRNLLEKTDSIPIKSDLLEIFGIKKIAIQNIGWPGVPGEPEMQGYDIDAMSDTDFELEYVEDEKNK